MRRITRSLAALSGAVALLAACGGGAGEPAPAAPAPVPLPAPAPPPASPTPAPAPTPLAFALMDAGDRRAAFDAHAKLATVDGLAVRTSWKTLEPARRQYDWTVLDEAAAAAAAQGKLLGLHIIASGYASPPDWLAAQGLQTYGYVDPLGRAVTDPVPWDGAFLSEWKTFADALAAHLTTSGALARLRYVSVAVPVPEMSMPGCAQGRLGTSGPTYDRALYLGAWKSSVESLHAALPGVQKLLPVPVGTICRPDADGPAFYLEVLAQAQALPGSAFAFFATDLDAVGSKRMDGVASAAGRAPVALQFLAATGTSLRSAVCAGRMRYGAQLFEVYKQDLASTDPAVQAGVAAVRAGCP